MFRYLKVLCAGLTLLFSFFIYSFYFLVFSFYTFDVLVGDSRVVRLLAWVRREMGRMRY